MTKRRATPSFVLLLLITTFIVTFSSAQIPVSAVSISISPPSGPSGTVVTVTGSGFAGGDTTCTITATGPSTGFITSPTCTIASGSISSGSFTVGAGIKPGTYSVTVKGNTGDSAAANFNLGSTARSISFSPPNGAIGTTVSVTGVGFSTSTSCTITSSTGGLIAPGSTCTTDAFGDIPGGGGASFAVGPGIAPGTYSITVSDTNALSSSATFTLLQPPMTLTPQSGPINSNVNVESAGKFSPGDTSCAITSPTMIFSSRACSISNGVVTGEFQVGSANPAGPYEIEVTGSPSSVVASAIFTVTATTPAISVTPTDGPLGTKITVQGSGFSASDTTCQITASPDITTIAAGPSPSCSVGGSGKVTGTFHVGLTETINTHETITVIASPGGDSSSVAFTLDGFPQLTFNPASPQPAGTTVSVSVSAGQFSSSDVTTNGVTCTVSASGGLFQSSACAITGGGTLLTGTFFVVANVASGNTYTVTVKGALGDTASATFTVSSLPVGAAVYLSPSDGPAGTRISVSGLGFPGLDSSCILSASPTPLFAASPAPTCSISAGKVTASFNVASSATGTFTVTVTSSSGATASESFNVDATPTLSFTPLSPEPSGTTVQVSIGAGAFSTGDTSCTISSSPGSLFQSSLCHLSQSPQSLTGTFFVVSSAPSGSTYTVTVTGSMGDTASSTFTISPATTAQVVVSPSDGPGRTKITVEGTSFAGQDTSCILTSTGSVGGTTPNIIASPTCIVSSSGAVSGAFTVLNGADPLGNPYTITVTGNSGDSGSFASFNVDGTPKLEFSAGPPATPGTTVKVSIANPPPQFSSGDTSCSIISLPSGLFANSACHVGAAGTSLTGTFFVVASLPSGSSYTVVVTGNLGDTATSPFSVAAPPSVAMVVNYLIVRGGNPTAPNFNYFLGGVSRSLRLTNTPSAIYVDSGTSWSVTLNPLGGSSSSQRWYSNQPLTGTASSTPIAFVFYRQTWQKFFYSVKGGGSTYSPPVFQVNQFGSPAPVALSSVAIAYWFDYGSSWTVTNPLVGSTSSERWYTTQVTVGIIGGSSTRAFTYQHQFYLTVLVSPSGAGSVSPSSNWYSSGQKVTIQAAVKTGHKFLSWSGTGTGGYTGTKASTMITMNSAITETAYLT